MKKIIVNCDSCNAGIGRNVLYASLFLAGLEEMNFCGVTCFDDYMKDPYFIEKLKKLL